ncbi:MAG: PAS domain-containing protein [Spirochaetales bacterium]|nr:PAS domain-containing protein [Spirochaetales bacterium]
MFFLKEFAQLIATISTEFVNLDSVQIDESINKALRLIGEFVAIDRSYIFQFRDGNKIIDNTHEWCAQGIEPHIAGLKNLPVKSYPWITARLLKGEVVYFTELAELPARAAVERERFAAAGIKSLVNVPMTFKSHVRGFMGFETIRKERAWDEEVVLLLRLIGETFSSALARKHTEQALHESEERLKLAMEATSDGVFDWHMQTGEAYFSPSYFRMLGYHPDELPASTDTWQNLIYPEDGKYMQKIAEEYFQGKRVSHEAEYRMNTKEGGYKWVLSRGKAVEFDEKHMPLRMVGTHTDITERKNAEQKLKHTELRLRSLIEQTSDAVFCYEYNPPIPIDLPLEKQIKRLYECVLVDCNLVCAQSYGFERIEDVIGRKLVDLFGTRPGNLNKLFRDLIQGGYRIIDGEGTEKLADGSERYFLNNGYGVIENGKLLRMWGTFRDITDRKKAQNELQKTQKLESLGIMAGGIAHDFNNLLGGIFGNIELAKDKIQNNAEALYFLDKAMSAYARTKDLTTQLLTFAKGGEPVKKSIPIQKVLTESCQLALSGSSIVCKTVLKSGNECVLADEGQLNQVFSNILINSRQAMPQGGKILITAQEIKVRHKDRKNVEPGNYVEVSIKDQGIGIPQNIIARIFDPFFTTKQQGSGLGLAVSYSIIAKHNGYIDVASKQGQGSLFQILLPAGNLFECQAEEPSEDTVKRGGSVLLMEDEPVVLDVVRNILIKFGYNVESALNGEEAVELFRTALKDKKPFDIVILDLTVAGGMGGEWAVTKIRELDKNAVVIASSGYSASHIFSHFKDYGFSGVIAKPYRMKELKELINNLIVDKT